MQKRAQIQKLDDYFAPLGTRPQRAVYFTRIAGYSDAVGDFVHRYYGTARQKGAVITGHIPSPDEGNLSYYDGMLGKAFQLDREFFLASLKKWLPRMALPQAEAVADAIFACLDAMRAAGKNENILKNTYIKFMCWLYYRFEPVVRYLGKEDAPKVLFDGDATNHELQFLSVLSQAGCDVVLVERAGDAAYLRVDAQSKLSDLWQGEGLGAFPEGFSLQEEPKDAARQQLYGQLPKLSPCTNAWLTGKDIFADLRIPPAQRGEDASFFYNTLIRIRGVENKASYVNDLYLLYQELKNAGRKIAVVDGAVPMPAPEEIAAVKRQNAYKDVPQVVHDLGWNNISYPAQPELQHIMMKSFVDAMMDEAAAEKGANINRLVNKGVYLICWLKRYMSELFSGWKPGSVGVFFHTGPCSNANDAFFLRFLARLPVDVVVLVPDSSAACQLDDEVLYEKHFPESMPVMRFPKEASDVQVGTVAFHAERELDTLMYQDTGMYRNQQYAKANALTLKTMYEEIPILWKAEIKFRPNFGTVGGVVNVPVIFSKVSGVKDGDQRAYWDTVRELAGEKDVITITSVPHIASGSPNPMKSAAASFLRNGRLQRDKIKEHKDYPYSFLREETQEHILDKLQLLIDQKLIKGMGENGTEYTVIATVLNLDKDVVRLIQKFDFTKTTPKLVFVITGEQMLSLEDTIMVAFLNLVGFDIIFFVPTGYQAVEKYFNRDMIEEHQIGEYLYDMQVPDLKAPHRAKPFEALRNTFFKRR